MSDVDAASPAPPAQDTTPTPKPESPLRLIAVAVGWLVLALVMVVVADITVSLVTDDKSVLRDELSSIATSVALYGVLLWAALVRGRIVGGGDVRTGLGDGPVSRWPVIGAIGILTIVAVALVVAAYVHGYIDLPARAPAREKSLWVLFFSASVAVLIAPPVEEFWFRGWLWTGLRKRWSPLATMLVTGAFFVALHVPQTFSAFGHHVMAAALLSLARYFGGSVRASITIHAIWNFTTMAALAALFLLYGDS